jgi:hypothetical protein
VSFTQPGLRGLAKASASGACPRARHTIDPIVLSHAQALLTSSPEGATAFIDADLREVGTNVQRAAAVLDFGQPAAVMLLGILQGIPDRDEPGAIIARLMDAVTPGSYLAIGRPGAGIAAKPGAGNGLGQGSSRRTSQRGLPPRRPEVWRTRLNSCASNSWTVPT